MVVLVEVGDVADLRDCQPTPATPRGGTTNLQWAEANGEVTQLRIGKALVAEDDHGVTIDGGPDGIDGGGVERSAQIRAGDLGSERCSKWSRVHGHSASLPQRATPSHPLVQPGLPPGIEVFSALLSSF